MSAGASSDVTRVQRVMRAFLIADVRGYSTFTEQRGIEATSALAARFVALATRSVDAAGGRVAGVRGDQVLAVFESPRAALSAALALQRDLLSSTRQDPSLPLPVGIGLDLGEAVEVDGEWTATAVNVAARLCDAAAGGEILATQALADAVSAVDGVSGVDGARATARAPTALKGIDRPVRVVRVAHADLDVGAELRRLRLTRAATPPPRSGGITRVTRWLPSRRRGALAGAACLALVVAAGLTAAVTRHPSSAEPPTSRVRADSVGLLDPVSGQRRADVPLGLEPGAIAAGNGAVWVVSPAAGTLTRLSSASPVHTPAVSVPVGDRPSAVAVGGGAEWVANSADRSVSRVDAPAGGTAPTVADTIGVGNEPTAVAVGYHRVWVANGIDGTISVIDPDASRGRPADRVVATIPVGAQPAALVAGRGGVWVALGASARVVRIDPSSLRVDASVAVGGEPSALAVDSSGLWVANSADATLSRVDTASLSVAATVAVGRSPDAVVPVNGAVWVADRDSDDLREVRAGAVRRTLVVAHGPVGLAATHDGLWVGVGEATTAHRGGTLRVVDSSGYLTTLDPARGYLQLAWNVESVVHDGLVTFERTGGPRGGTVVPDLAARLPRISRDGRTYTFRLRRGLRFSNGAPVRAGDVRASFERMLRSPDVPPYYSAIEGAARCSRTVCDLSKGVRTDDATGTVRLRLSHPDPDLLYRLAIPFADVLPAGTPARDLGFTTVPATGPYVVASSTRTSVTLARNRRFVPWSSAAQPPGYPNRIVVTFGRTAHDASPAAQVRATVAGTYDWSADPVPADRLADLIKTRTSQVPGFVDGSVHYFYLNTRVPPFTDVRVRRAVNLAVDRGAALRAFGGTAAGQTTCQVVAPSLPGYRADCPYTAHPDAGGTWSAPDLGRARSLVRRAHAVGAHVRVLTMSTEVAVGRVMVRAMRAAGLDATLGVRPDDVHGYYDYIGRPANRVQSALEGWEVDYPSPSNLFGPLLRCGSRTTSGNLDEAMFCDRRVDRDIDAALALQTSDPTAAGMRWARVDREVTAAAPWVPLTNGIVHDAVSARLGNFEDNPEFGMLIDQAWVR